MAWNYLNVVLGDAIKLFMANAAFNFKKLMLKLGHFLLFSRFFLFPSVAPKNVNIYRFSKAGHACMNNIRETSVLFEIP